MGSVWIAADNLRGFKLLALRSVEGLVEEVGDVARATAGRVGNAISQASNALFGGDN